MRITWLSLLLLLLFSLTYANEPCTGQWGDWEEWSTCPSNPSSDILNFQRRIRVCQATPDDCYVEEAYNCQGSYSEVNGCPSKTSTLSSTSTRSTTSTTQSLTSTRSTPTSIRSTSSTMSTPTSMRSTSTTRSTPTSTRSSTSAISTTESSASTQPETTASSSETTYVSDTTPTSSQETIGTDLSVSTTDLTTMENTESSSTTAPSNSESSTENQASSIESSGSTTDSEKSTSESSPSSTDTAESATQLSTDSLATSTDPIDSSTDSSQSPTDRTTISSSTLPDNCDSCQQLQVHKFGEDLDAVTVLNRYTLNGCKYVNLLCRPITTSDTRSVSTVYNEDLIEKGSLRDTFICSDGEWKPVESNKIVSSVSCVYDAPITDDPVITTTPSGVITTTSTPGIDPNNPCMNCSYLVVTPPSPRIEGSTFMEHFVDDCHTVEIFCTSRIDGQEAELIFENSGNSLFGTGINRTFTCNRDSEWVDTTTKEIVDSISCAIRDNAETDGTTIDTTELTTDANTDETDITSDAGTKETTVGISSETGETGSTGGTTDSSTETTDSSSRDTGGTTDSSTEETAELSSSETGGTTDASTDNTEETTNFNTETTDSSSRDTGGTTDSSTDEATGGSSSESDGTTDTSTNDTEGTTDTSTNETTDSSSSDTEETTDSGAEGTSDASSTDSSTGWTSDFGSTDPSTDGSSDSSSRDTEGATDFSTGVTSDSSSSETGGTTDSSSLETTGASTEESTAEQTTDTSTETSGTSENADVTDTSAATEETTEETPETTVRRTTYSSTTKKSSTSSPSATTAFSSSTLSTTLSTTRTSSTTSSTTRTSITSASSTTGIITTAASMTATPGACAQCPNFAAVALQRADYYNGMLVLDHYTAEDSICRVIDIACRPSNSEDKTTLIFDRTMDELNKKGAIQLQLICNATGEWVYNGKVVKTASCLAQAVSSGVTGSTSSGVSTTLTTTVSTTTTSVVVQPGERACEKCSRLTVDEINDDDMYYDGFTTLVSYTKSDCNAVHLTCEGNTESDGIVFVMSKTELMKGTGKMQMNLTCNDMAVWTNEQGIVVPNIACGIRRIFTTTVTTTTLRSTVPTSTVISSTITESLCSKCPNLEGEAPPSLGPDEDIGTLILDHYFHPTTNCRVVIIRCRGASTYDNLTLYFNGNEIMSAPYHVSGSLTCSSTGIFSRLGVEMKTAACKIKRLASGQTTVGSTATASPITTTTAPGTIACSNCNRMFVVGVPSGYRSGLLTMDTVRQPDSCIQVLLSCAAPVSGEPVVILNKDATPIIEAFDRINLTLTCNEKSEWITDQSVLVPSLSCGQMTTAATTASTTMPVPITDSSCDSAEWAAWEEWSTCPTPCGSCGSIQRFRVCNKPATECRCPGSAIDKVVCNTHVCLYPYPKEINQSCCSGFRPTSDKGQFHCLREQ